MSVPPPRTPGPRASGIRIGYLEPGPLNAITDVPGVRVGHVTIWRDEPDPPNLSVERSREAPASDFSLTRHARLTRHAQE